MDITERVTELTGGQHEFLYMVARMGRGMPYLMGVPMGGKGLMTLSREIKWALDQ